MADENWISVKQTADLLGYSRVHIVRLIKSGKIEAKRVGRSYIVNQSSLGGIFRQLQPNDRRTVQKAVKKVVDDFEPVLKKLGQE